MSIISDTFTVYLEDPDISPEEGTTRTLNCQLEELKDYENQISTIGWKRDGQLLSTNGAKYHGLTSTLLTINYLNTQDNAQYSCSIIYSGKKVDSRTYTLTVTCKYILNYW